MNVLDLFSGIGGFSLGLERAGMKTIAFCEIDKKAQLVLKKHWPNVPIFEDVSTLNKEDLNEQVDVICGGFPCQDISLAGRGAGLAGARSGLWYEFHRLIKEIRPRYAIIENVSALRSRGLDKVLWSLAEIGYDAEWHCIPASAVGAPHQRDRIWIVAYPSSWGCQGLYDWHPESENAFTSSENVAHANIADVWGGGVLGSFGNEEWRVPEAERESLQPEDRKSCSDDTEQGGTPLAHTNSAQREGGGLPGRILTENANLGGTSWWEVEPSVGRVAHGVPNWSHRLKQLGNAVVPQIPEAIGRAIMASHEKGSA